MIEGTHINILCKRRSIDTVQSSKTLKYQIRLTMNSSMYHDERIHDQSLSLTGFNQLVIKDILDSYSYMRVLIQCRTCGRT